MAHVSPCTNTSLQQLAFLSGIQGYFFSVLLLLLAIFPFFTACFCCWLQLSQAGGERCGPAKVQHNLPLCLCLE